FEKKETIPDLETITADFLIEHIDYAFKAWEEKPWAQDLTFDQFCNYVLPYRGSSEPLEPWRKYFWEKYKDISKQVDDPTDPVQIAAAINNDIMSWFRFDSRYYLHPTDQGFQEMLDGNLGRCEDMTNLTIFAMRANGLAVVSDYTPYWANIGNNHAWNAIVKPDGEVIPFMGAEANPGKYRLSYKMGKTYRKMYAKQPRNLTFQERKQEDLPRWLAGKSYTDVTADYTEISDVVIAFSKEIPDTVDLAYLCVFNTGEWKPIEWGWVKSNKSLFTDMGVDVAYLPGLYLNKEIVPYSPPFILTEDKQVKMLLPEADKTQTIVLTSTTKRIQDLSTEGMQVTHLKEGTEYTLSYWQDGWMEIGKQTAGDEPLTFENVPAGGLYWLIPDDGGEEERIFTIEDGVQVWW
ncbi:transglutaminase-like domain-containing protein, partial [bacterium]|nr:transglutaminase-like domain-containing protein [bacterium]